MNCDLIAPLYVFGERLLFGRALDRCRARFLPDLPPQQAALVCGDGDGRFLRALLERRGAQQVDYVDVSRRMTALAQKRTAICPGAGHDRVHFVCDDIRAVALARGYDLIATHFFLDCFDENEIAEVVHRIASHASANATWLLSEFQIPKRGLARHIGAIVIAGLYCVFHILTGLRARQLPDYAAALRQAGFTCAENVSSCGGLLTSQLWKRS